MATINQNYSKLNSSYLFADIAKRTKLFKENNPGVEVMRLGIGNTTEPLSPSVIQGLALGVHKLSEVTTYTGYGDEQGDARLRTALAVYYSQLGITLQPDEIFVSDGAKADSANISSIFGADNIVAVQDPVYPVYVDSNVIYGRSGPYTDGVYPGLRYLACTAENGFIPDVPREHVDIIYLCSPNNPTGAVATHSQLADFVAYAREHQAVLIFDAAYSSFITDPSLPRSIYEIEGAMECAIELNSFSKSAGFTGVRLGWCVVPMELVVQGTAKGEVNSVWNRRQTTMFNGASNIAQEGGLAVLTEQGQMECGLIVNYYMENARIILEGLQRLGLNVFGGVNAPYIWVKTQNRMSSWDFFEVLLEGAHVVCTPGVGFGRLGEGYVRLSAFGHRENVLQAVESITRNVRI